MRKKYKGYLLAADKSLEQPGETVGAIFQLPSFTSIFSDYFELTKTETIKRLKETVDNLSK